MVRESDKRKYPSRLRKNQKARSEKVTNTQVGAKHSESLNPPTFDSQPALRKKPQSKNMKAKKTVESKKIIGSSKTRKKGKTQHPVLKWIFRIFGITVILGIIGVITGCIVFAVLYNRTDIPSPNKFAQSQITTVYWGDGKTVMGKIASQNRTNIKINDLPKYVGNAVVASEDRTFYENNGVDFRAIGRAFINNLQGKPIQGASTLTQQYAENYYIGHNRSYTGKIKETILALKINRQQSKKEILNNYLNVIYFGRGSYGIEAASLAYYGKSAKNLTLSEAALLAGIIPAPSAWDPANDKDMAMKRWNRVLDLMVQDGWITKAERNKQKFPQTIKAIQNNKYYTGTNGYLLQQAKTEVNNKAGISLDDIERLGLKIYTTIQPDKQKALVDAVNNMPAGASPNLRVAAVSLDPRTGAIVAEYAGKDYEKIQANAVTQDRAKAGSSFKPFTLLGAITNGYKLTDKFDGNNPLILNNSKVYNYARVNYGQITLIDSLRNSVNTSFVRLNEKIGMKVSKDVAVAAGFPANTPNLDIDSPIGVLGVSYPHNIDLAQGYATFANLGVRVEHHIVAKVEDSAGNIIYEADTQGIRQFKESDVRILNTALKAAASGYKLSSLGRQVAGKTGTTDESAQFIGFINQLVTAVSLYQVGPNGEEEALTPFAGHEAIFGANVPKSIWLDYMKEAIKGTTAEEIPDSNNAKNSADKAENRYKKVEYENNNNRENKEVEVQKTNIPNIPRSEIKPDKEDNPDSSDERNTPSNSDSNNSPPNRPRQNN